MSWSALHNSTSSLSGIFAAEGLCIICTLADGTEVQGIRSQLKRADVNSDMGLLSGHYNFSVLFRCCDMPNIPAPRTGKIWIQGKPYRILSTQTDAVGATVRLDLGDILQ